MRKLGAIILLLVFSVTGMAQRSEIGGMVGTSFYLGDLNPTGLFAAPRIAGGVVYRYNFTPRWALKADILFAEVAASDMHNNKNYDRNLSFRSPITEISAQVELNFFKIYNIPARNRFSPYIYAGITAFSFNPQAELDGVLYDLQPLGTEGQGFEGEAERYSLFNFAIPFGLGVKVNIGKHICLGLEWGMRYTFTDYLDDVKGEYYDNDILRRERGDIVADLADRSEILHEAGSARGNIKTKDLYSFAVFMATFKIGNEDRTCDIRYQAKPRIKLGKKR